MNPLHEMIKRLPPRLEFLIVIMWAFGLPIFSSILSIGASDIDKREYFNNAGIAFAPVQDTSAFATCP